MAGKTVVVLCGGVGGLVTASKLRKRLGREHPVVLVDREGRHLLQPPRPVLHAKDGYPRWEVGQKGPARAGIA